MSVLDDPCNPIADADDHHGFAGRAVWVCRHLVYGSFIGAYRARRGLGQPKSPAALDAEYRAGTWSYLDSLPERSRHMIALGYMIGREGPRRVLDVGCGTGGLLELGENFPLSSYHGIDLSEAAILRARRRFRGKDRAFPVRLEVADFESFTSESRYDFIVFEESLPFARDPVVVLERYERFLSPRGVFLISLCYNWWQNPLMERITDAYPTLHSSEVINEEGLTWQVRMLAGHRSGESATLTMRTGKRPSSEGWSSLAEAWVMIGENMRAIIRGVPVLIAGFIAGGSREKKNDDEGLP